MTEVEKMRNGLLADMSSPELQVRFEHAKKLLARMRGMSTYDEGYRKLLEELVPRIPETSVICPPFYCDHGDGIKLADREFVVTQHVHHTDSRQADGIEVGALHLAGADQQSAVRTARDGEFVLRGILAGDEILGRRDEIIEDVLFVLQHPGLVPGGRRPDPDPHRVEGRARRRQTHFEAYRRGGGHLCVPVPEHRGAL